MTATRVPVLGQESATDLASRLPGRLEAEGRLLVAPAKIHTTASRIVLSQKTRLWFRAAFCLWATVVLLTPFMLYSQLFSAQTTRLTCDRATNICAVDGSSRDVPRVDEIARAEMNHDSNRRDGPNWGIDLVTRDGRKHPIEQQRAIANAVVANYAAAVAATNAYLANRAQPALDVSFTYRASLGEKLQTVFYLLFGIATLIAGWALWTRRSYIFEHDCVNAIERRLFFQTKAVIAVDRIAAIYDRPFRDGRIVELAFEDGSRIGVLQAGARKAVEASRVAKELADYLAKPLKSVTASAP